MYTNRRMTLFFGPVARAGWYRVRVPKVGGVYEYCGGLWKSRFVQDLCWTANHEVVPHEAERKVPSWSWASVCGSVDYEYAKLGEQRTRLVDVVCEMGTNPFGELKGGYAVLEGPVFASTLTIEDGKWAMYGDNMPQWMAPTFRPDVPIEVVTYRDEGATSGSKGCARRAKKGAGQAVI